MVDSVEMSRVPLVIELSGMPKVGKTACVDALVDLFRRSGCRVATSPDASADFPVADRWSIDFSAWAITAFIKRFLELKQCRQQIVVADRGLFDAIAWLRLKTELGKCDQNTLANLRGFAHTRLWWSHQCLVLVFYSAVDEVLRRGAQRRLYEGESLVTTKSNLAALRRALEDETELCNRQRRLVRPLYAGRKSMKHVLHEAAEKVVSSLDEHLRGV